MKKIVFTIGLLAILVLNACDKKSCDCEGLIGEQLSYDINQNELENCIVVENFTFKGDSTLSIQRYYKDSEGDTNSSTIDVVADWRLVSTNPCVYEVSNLRGATYGFPFVENSCSGEVNTNYSFFYDLQFATGISIEINNQTCDGATVNGETMKCE